MRNGAAQLDSVGEPRTKDGRAIQEPSEYKFIAKLLVGNTILKSLKPCKNSC